MFTVGEHFHCLPDVVGEYSISELLVIYKRVLRSQWNLGMAQTRAVELGTTRAITQAFSSKKARLPDLPDFDRAMRDMLPPGARLPDWMRKFEEANSPKDDDGAPD